MKQPYDPSKKNCRRGLSGLSVPCEDTVAEIGLLRDEFPRYWAERGLVGAAVEVGVYRGNFSECILKQWPGVLHCVDPWVYQADQLDYLNHPQEAMDAAYVEACTRLAPYTSTRRCHIHRQFSVEAAQSDWAHDLDIVYIDARHDYRSVYADLVAWYPKVKVGGIIAGHDYLEGHYRTTEGPGTTFGVKSAVAKFFGDLGYDIERDVIVNRDPFPSWTVVVR